MGKYVYAAHTTIFQLKSCDGSCPETQPDSLTKVLHGGLYNQLETCFLRRTFCPWLSSNVNNTMLYEFGSS